jgi:hypothetical protein
MTKTIKKIAIYLTEWHMLKIYATIMTTAFLCIWIPTMFVAIKNVIMQVILPIFK